MHVGLPAITPTRMLAGISLHRHPVAHSTTPLSTLPSVLTHAAHSLALTPPPHRCLGPLPPPQPPPKSAPSPPHPRGDPHDHLMGWAGMAR